MRIVILVPAFPKLSETFVVAHFVGLADRGWDVHVECREHVSRDWTLFPDLVERPHLRRRVHAFQVSQRRWLICLQYPFLLARAILRSPIATLRYFQRGRRILGANILRRFPIDSSLIALSPDLVHFEFGAQAVGRMHLRDCLATRVVVSFRGYDLNYVGLEDAEHYRTVWDGSHAIHLLGDDLWRRAQSRGCPADKRHALIPPAVGLNWFEPTGRVRRHVRGSPERPLRVLSVGRLEWVKGYDYALQAIRLLRDRGLRSEYRIVGDGFYTRAVAFARHQLGLEGQVDLLGAQAPEEVRGHLGWADVLLQASVSEGFCNAVVEAQAMEVPVVSSDAGGLPENVQDEVTGLVVARRDAVALAEALSRLAGDPELRQRMGKAGRARVLARFNVADQISSFERLYRAVLGGPDTSFP